MLNDDQKKLVEKNHNLIYGFMRDYNVIDKEYYYFVLAESLCKAAAEYNGSVGKFSTFAYRVMKNDYLRDIRDMKAGKRNFEGEMIYLDDIAFESDKCDKHSLFGFDENFDEKIIERIRINKIVSESHEILSKNERKVFLAILNGMTYDDIYLKYGIKNKSAMMMFRNARKKIKCYKI